MSSSSSSSFCVAANGGGKKLAQLKAKAASGGAKAGAKDNYAIVGGGHVLCKNVCDKRAKDGARVEQMKVGQIYEVPIGAHSNLTQDELDVVQSEAFGNIEPFTFEGDQKKFEARVDAVCEGLEDRDAEEGEEEEKKEEDEAVDEDEEDEEEDGRDKKEIRMFLKETIQPVGAYAVLVGINYPGFKGSSAGNTRLVQWVPHAPGDLLGAPSEKKLQSGLVFYDDLEEDSSPSNPMGEKSAGTPGVCWDVFRKARCIAVLDKDAGSKSSWRPKGSSTQGKLQYLKEPAWASVLAKVPASVRATIEGQEQPSAKRQRLTSD